MINWKRNILQAQLNILYQYLANRHTQTFDSFCWAVCVIQTNNLYFTPHNYFDLVKACDFLPWLFSYITIDNVRGPSHLAQRW